MTRQDLVGNTLEGHTVTAADALRVGIMQYYFWNKAGVGDANARGLTQRAVSALEGHSIVVFEYLYDENMKEMAKHTDIEDEGQTIVFPKARTKAADEVTKTNIVNPAEDISVKDILYYENLLVGKEYLITATLMDKKTEKPVLDDDGNEVTTTKRFTAETTDGSQEVIFEFSGVKLPGTVMVAFEKVSILGIEIMAHADINDDDQTLYVPKIATTASEKDTGAKEMDSSGTKELADHVAYECLPAGNYIMQGTLMDKAAGKALTDKDGREITSSAAFTAETNEGSVDMTFTVNADELSGKTVVVFEKVFAADTSGEPAGEPVAVHEDLDDADQTVTFPAVSTELIDEKTGSHMARADKKVKHIDHVKLQ